MIKPAVLGLLTCSLLVACAPKALIPEDFKYKSHLFGNVKNGIYTASVGRIPGRGYFSLHIPQTRNRYEKIFLRTAEYYGNNYTWVRFGTVASDKTIYYAFVGLKYGEPLALYRDRKLPFFVESAEKGYYRQMDKIYEEQISICGHPAIYEVYTQKLAGYYNYIGMHQPGEVIFTHGFYTIDYGRYGVILWTQASDGSGFDLLNDENRYQMLEQTWEPQIRFVRNFILYPQIRGVDCQKALFCRGNYS